MNHLLSKNIKGRIENDLKNSLVTFLYKDDGNIDNILIIG